MPQGTLPFVTLPNGEIINWMQVTKVAYVKRYVERADVVKLEVQTTDGGAVTVDQGEAADLVYHWFKNNSDVIKLNESKETDNKDDAERIAERFSHLTSPSA